MKIVIGCDHAAYDAKETLKRLLSSRNVEVVDVGTYSSERCDYPDFSIKLVKEVIHQNLTGILLCGSGIGASMVANRFKGIRAALCRSAHDAEMARRHNNANVLCLGARFSDESEINSIIDAWMSNSFEGGRHTDRLKKFENLGESL